MISARSRFGRFLIIFISLNADIFYPTAEPRNLTASASLQPASDVLKYAFTSCIVAATATLTRE